MRNFNDSLNLREDDLGFIIDSVNNMFFQGEGLDIG